MADVAFPEAVMAVNAGYKGAFASFKCIPRRYLKPTMRSNSSNGIFVASVVRRS